MRAAYYIDGDQVVRAISCEPDSSYADLLDSICPRHPTLNHDRSAFQLYKVDGITLQELDQFDSLTAALAGRPECISPVTMYVYDVGELPAGTLHFYIKPDGTDTAIPSAARLTGRAAALAQARDAPSPSSTAQLSNFREEQAVRPIYNARPNPAASCGLRELDAPAAALFHPAFGRFLDIVRTGQVDDAAPRNHPDIYRKVNQLLLVSTQVYRTEDARRHDVIPLLEDLLSQKFIYMEYNSKTSSESWNNGSARFTVGHVGGSDAFTGLLEMKNEIGDGACDPSIQGALSFRKAVSAMPSMYETSRCACFIIAIAGPWLQISAAHLTDIWSVQPMTDYVYIGAGPSLETRVESVSRVFLALRTCLKDLERYYADLPKTPVDASVLFPYPTSCELRDGSELTWTYEEEMARNTASIYRASTPDKRKLVIKFTRRYGAAAHELLAEHRLAPTLHRCERLPGGIFMVVMDYVPGEHITSANRPVVEAVSKAVQLLHRAGIVFGDLRTPNIMIVTRTTSKDAMEVDEAPVVQLIDFDWAGKEGEVWYPLTLNDNPDNIAWPKGEQRGGVIMKKHDEDMLEALGIEARSTVGGSGIVHNIEDS